jgi:ATP-dependent Clp protease ATP-binding subunit ClpB
MANMQGAPGSDEEQQSALEKYGVDLTAIARTGKLDPVIGRDAEIRRVSQVLTRRTKNNPVLIGEPGVGKTAVVEGLAQRIVAGDVADSLKGKRLVSLDLAALVAAAALSNRYIPGRQLPDKAIDLIDEAASRLRMEIDSAPVEIDELRRSVDRLTLEELALKKEKDEASKQRLEKLRSDLVAKGKALKELQGRWEKERAVLNRIGELKEKLDSARMQAERAQREGNLEKASRLLYGEIPVIERELAEAEKSEAGTPLMVNDQVTAEDIAAVIAMWTGIPVGRLMQGETEKLLGLEGELGKRLVGQKRAVRAVAEAVRRSRAGIADADRPTGSFLFLGPTGVGKTELAKALAEFLFDNEKAMIRIDMSEYGERHSVARLLGAPPGYIGYEQGGQLTEAVRRRPYSVVLLDEVEKAHSDVFDVLLQVLDDGRLTDGQGRTVDFRNVILILTSNLGSQYLVDQTLSLEAKEEAVNAMVRQSFKPEFLNRLDDIVIFSVLSKDDLAQIVELYIDRLSRRLQDRRLELAVTPDARAWLAERGFDPIYGARPLRRLMQHEIDDKLATALLGGEIRDGDTVRVDLDSDNDTLTIHKTA